MTSEPAHPAIPPARFADLLAGLIDAVLTSPGRLPPERRRAAFEGEPLPGAVGAFAEKVRRRAYTVTDDDITALRGLGMEEDAIFELTIACALGEAYSQLQAGLRAIEDGR
jgi:hypothetical protein